MPLSVHCEGHDMETHSCPSPNKVGAHHFSDYLPVQVRQSYLGFRAMMVDCVSKKQVG